MSHVVSGHICKTPQGQKSSSYPVAFRMQVLGISLLAYFLLDLEVKSVFYTMSHFQVATRGTAFFGPFSLD